MLIPGPSKTPTRCEAASRPRAAPTRPTSSLSQVSARVTAVGKQVAGRLSPSPMWLDPSS